MPIEFVNRNWPLGWRRGTKAAGQSTSVCLGVPCADDRAVVQRCAAQLQRSPRCSVGILPLRSAAS